MSRREELQKQYAEYERKLDEVKEKVPENPVCKVDSRYNGNVTMIYAINDDVFEITKRTGNGNVSGSVTLYDDEAEKLYHFLGGLYG
jgi:hypothetical protein